MTEYLLGLDVGTSSMCAVLTDTSLRPVSIAHAPMSYYRPPDSSLITWEFDGKTLLDLAGDLVTKTLYQHGASPTDVSALGITSQRQAVVLLDANGQSLLCSPNFDMRGVFHGAAIDGRIGEQVYSLTGHFPAFVLACSRIHWLRDTIPDLYSRLHTVLPLASWLGFELTGARVSEPAIDAEAGLLDVTLHSRSPRLEDALEIENSWLPPLCPAGAMLGGLKADLENSWGLAVGTPVAIAGPDTQSALIGLGATDAGQRVAVLGWSGALQQITNEPCFDPEKRTWAGLHTIEGKWVAEANLGDLGQAYRWMKELIVGTEASMQMADAMAANIEPGAEGVMVKLGGAHETAPEAGLTTGGLTIPVPLTFQKATPAHIMRAALESIAFTVKANLSTLEGSGRSQRRNGVRNRRHGLQSGAHADIGRCDRHPGTVQQSTRSPRRGGPQLSAESLLNCLATCLMPSTTVTTQVSLTTPTRPPLLTTISTTNGGPTWPRP